jgi:CPA1 family monovalent cation:H+ antiporter
MSNVALFELILLLLAFAVLLAVGAARLRLPPAIAFTLGGMALALIPGLDVLAMDPALVMVLFLPPLLQASAFFTDWRAFRANLRPILLLAVGCVLFTTLVVGWVLKLLVPELPWAVCFAFGAIVSPPDAVAAAAVLQRLRIPRRIVTILEGESLVNDASGLVLYRFAIAAALSGTFHAPTAAGMFVLVALGGIAVGLAVGWLFIRGLRWLGGDTNLEIAASFLVAWASYIAAEWVQASGVLATVACGLLMGWRQHETFSSRTRLEARAAWSFIVFVMEALVFVLIGLALQPLAQQVRWAQVPELALQAFAVSLAAIVARFMWVFPATYLPRWLIPSLARRDPAPAIAAPIVISWAGMRGVVSLAAALAVPAQVPGRDLILFLTFAVILTTLVVQGLTLEWVIRATCLDRMERRPDVPPEAAARAHAARAAHAHIAARAQDPLDGAMAADLLKEYADKADVLSAHATTAAARATLQSRIALRLEALAASRAALLALHRAREADDAALNAVEQELDLEELRLRRIVGGNAH